MFHGYICSKNLKLILNSVDIPSIQPHVDVDRCDCVFSCLDAQRTVFEEESEEKEQGEIEVFPRQYSERFLLRFESLRFALQLNLADVENGKGNKKCNPEPFFLTFALYDATEAKKISEDFHLDPNEPEISAMIPADLLAATDKLQTVNGRESTSPPLKGLQSSWLGQSARQGIFSIVRRHQEIYLVARIEKVLQGGVTQCIDPYIKGSDPKMALKVHRQMKQFCSHIGHYRMPFAWSAIAYDSYINNLYVMPMSLKYDGQKSFTKRIYGRPGQSVFTTTASTTVLHHAQIPDFMEEVKVSLPVQLRERHHLLFRFYHVSCEASKSSGSTSGRASSGKKKDSIEMPVGYAWLPLLQDGSGSTSGRASSGKKKDSIEMPVGYAWLPLLQDGRPVTGEKVIPVAASLPAFYLSHDSLSLTKSTGSDVKWVDGGRPLFKLNLHLVSTVYTQDHHLHNFFLHCHRVEQGGSLALDMNSVNKIKMENGGGGDQGDAIYVSPSDLQALLNGVKSLLAMEVSTYVQFLPTLVNQLLQLLSKTVSEDVAVNSVRVLIHVVSEVTGAHKHESLEKYVKYIFRPDKGSKNQRTVHEELSKHLTTILRPANTDPLVVTRFLKHAWFFFDILLKSMTLYLIDTDRVKMPRNERFSGECQYRIQNLLHVVTLHIIQKCKDYKDETKNANHSLANFVKSCFTLMDRGYVFKLVSSYIENFNPGDTKTLHDFKFEFLRIVCSHEHFIPLSLPLMRKGMVKNFKENINNNSKNNNNKNSSSNINNNSNDETL
ncbi:dedicator of cytokinesis protein 9 [Elysia marginata]|uniref:Dedicator of cytokinesis protein 9 n=1 Tax=Elysia marginata TaxID=1093978 RepID=A0AAV4J7B0_9GAST|nr:dedicator of cytokinesis protein 9 [Elysia marginata]